MRPILVVAGGGVLGATLRWGLTELIPAEGGSFPWATLIVNVIGCLGIGVAARRLQRDSEAWLAVVVGVLGGLTTFSTYAVETRLLVAAERPGLAIVYVVATVLAGVTAVEVARHDRRPST